jgi:predicted ribosomally synthesized peptide with SipW-like signal peptide
MRKLLITVLLVGIVGSVAGSATFSAFSSTTSNSGNSFAAGTVFVSDNDAGSVLYNVSNQAPNSPAVAKCIKVTYTGTLPADVHLYTGSTTNALDTYVNLTVEKGTVSGSPAFPSCTGFTPDSGGTIYNGTLAGFAGAKNTYASGVSAYPGSQTAWNQNDTLYFRFTLGLQDDNNANGGATPLSAASRTFTWEARNQ